MPKKSNKTDHVLNLLTTGRQDDDSGKKQPPPQSLSGSVSPSPIQSPIGTDFSFNVDSPKNRRVIVEEPKMREDLSNLVRQGLEKEMESQKKPKKDEKSFVLLDEENMEYVSGSSYILEDFNESNESEDIVMNDENFKTPNPLATDYSQKPEEFLHNVAEDIMISKAPTIMESMNMCTCQTCVYDVVALALNNTKPLYTVTKKGELFQKLASYELQYGTDIAREITRACIQIKMNPRHEGTAK